MDHRLFGVLDLDETTSRAAWLEMAKTEIAKAFKEGKQPILIGGSRSLAAELAEAAYNIRLDVDLNNAITFPRDNTAQPSFNYSLYTVILTPPGAYSHNAILERIKKNTSAALEAVLRARENGYSPTSPAFWVFGAKEYAQVLDGKMGLKQAQGIIAQKTIYYAHEQKKLFARLESLIQQKDPSKVLRIETTDNSRRIEDVMAYIRQQNIFNSPIPASKKAPALGRMP